MTNLKNHPTLWMRDDAAKAFDSAEDKHGTYTVNSAGRFESQQQGLINRWDKGGVYNRPPYLYEPARPAATSNHVAHGGIAIDIANWRAFAVVAAEFGFNHLYPNSDPVHFEFIGINHPDFAEFKQVTLDRQNFLNSIGYGLVPDGREGPLTKAAYKKYQSFLRKYDYTGPIDGIWGGGTQTAHAKYYAVLKAPKKKSHATLVKGSKGADVRLWQNFLKSNYPLYASRLKVDSDFGNDTVLKTKEWQRRSGLKVDGVVGPKSWARSGL